jgi:Ca-activated chloride channel family protein
LEQVMNKRAIALAAVTSLWIGQPALARRAIPGPPPVKVSVKGAGIISGRVVEQKSGAVLAGVAVLVRSKALTLGTTTDGNGRYLISGLIPGRYTVTFTSPDGTMARRAATIVDGKTTTLDVTLAAPRPEKKTEVAPHAAPRPSLVQRDRGHGGAMAVPMKMPLPSRPPPPPPPGGDPQGGEDYAHQDPNGFIDASKDKLSTFAADVDTASYTIVRRKLNEGQPVPKDAVRVEEFVNYFNYGYLAPTAKGRPFAVHVDGAPSPFDRSGHQLLRIGVQGRTIAKAARKPAHLVFLVDVSGSMQSPDKLALAQRSLRLLVDNLNDGDTVALVTYAGSTRVVLEPTGLDERTRIEDAIDGLTAGGSTAMGSGLALAYDLAARNLDKNAVTRVIVLSDGDANVGATTHAQILNSIAAHVKQGVTLSTVGFGQGNYKDTMMEQLADEGNGNAYYIDSLSQAKRVFQEQLGGTLEVIAEDVKLQVELNPAEIASYRLIGYENRDLADQDFRDDRVDAGEIGAGHTVTAIYEVVWAPGRKLDAGANLATVRVRAKQPGGTRADEWAFPVTNADLASSFAAASDDFRFACAVAAFAEILRGSSYARDWQLSDVASIARAAAGTAEDRNEFVALVGKAHRP